MIDETTSPRGRPALTSDRWHVVLARWSGDLGLRARFERAIVSEHADHASAVAAARQWHAQFTQQARTRAREHCDQVFVRQPRFRTLRRAKRHVRRRERKAAERVADRPFGEGLV